MVPALVEQQKKVTKLKRRGKQLRPEEKHRRRVLEIGSAAEPIINHGML